ncbi:TetR/AcrR family transcriptional regulator, partial [Streptomyces sp. NPDC058657]
EGALPPGDHTRQVRFLLTVLNGLSVERALPTRESVLAAETETLNAAVDHILTTRPVPPAGPPRP